LGNLSDKGREGRKKFTTDEHGCTRIHQKHFNL
jgi:hypothetical protein